MFGIEWFGTFFLVFWLFGCLLAGGAAGGTVVPLLRAIFHFDAADSIVLSNLSLVTATIACIISNFKTKHPLKKDLEGKPTSLVFDYDLVMIMLPSGVVGSALGAIIPPYLPEPILISVLTLCLMGIITMTTHKLVMMVRMEN